MGQATNKIEAHIESTRAELGANLQEFEQKVKAATDWKQHFQNNPMTMIGIAFGGGIVLAGMLGGGRRRRAYSRPTGGDPQTLHNHAQHQALQTLDTIKDALIGVAATKIKDFVGEIVPGFQEELRRTEAKLKGTLS